MSIDLDLSAWRLGAEAMVGKKSNEIIQKVIQLSIEPSGMSIAGFPLNRCSENRAGQGIVSLWH